MKTFRLIAAGFVFAAVFAISAFAQTGATAQGAGPAKIVVIDSGLFGGTDERGTGGITKYVNANTQLVNEFKPIQTDLDNTVTKLQGMQKELQALQAAAANPGATKVPFNEKEAAAKAEAFQTLTTEYKRKQEDAKGKYERRQAEVMNPVMQDIFKALQDYTKQKGFGMILDGAKLDAGQIVLGYDPDKVDVTKDFITFYNTRPATTASTAVPK